MITIEQNKYAITEKELSFIKKHYSNITNHKTMTNPEKIGYIAAVFAVDPHLSSWRTLEDLIIALRNVTLL